jgi:ribosomal protein L7/L12
MEEDLIYDMPIAMPAVACDENYMLGDPYYDVILIESGLNKIQLILMLRQIVPKMIDLRPAKDLIYDTPSQIMTEITKENAITIKRKFESWGAKVELVENPTRQAHSFYEDIDCENRIKNIQYKPL